MGKQTESERSLGTKVKDILFQRLVILQWLPKYTKNDILADLIAGLTVGLTMMPQSIAYAGLAGLPAQYGLYTAFIGSFTYIFVGTIKEVSIGPTSLMSLLTFSYTVGKPIECVILLAFIAGCVELLMGILKLGFLVDFISPCLTSGFTSASTIIIISNQLKNLLGINIHSHEFVGVTKELFQKYKEIRIPDTILGVTCIVILLFFKNLNRFVKTENSTVKKIIWLLSISKNAIVVLLATIVAGCWSKTGNTPFQIIGNVPKGVPVLSFPSLSTHFGNRTVETVEMVQSLGSGVFVVPLVAVLSNVAIAKSYSTSSVVDASQEMISLGIANIFGSFVRAMPSSGAFTRSAVASSSDVRTPLQGLYSGTVIILALSFLAPYFFFIPKAALGAVLITAVSSLFDYAIFPVLWGCSKVDFFLTISTLIIGTLFGVEAAIFIGAIFNIMFILKMWARPKIHIDLKQDSDDKGKYLYIKPELGLLYPGADYVYEYIKEVSNKNPTLSIILDCSTIVTLDYSAAKTLEKLLQMYNKSETNLALINIKDDHLKILEALADPSLFRYCSKSQEIPEIVILKPKHTEEKEPLLKDGGSKASSPRLEERRLSKSSHKGERRRSSVVARMTERKLSLYDNVERRLSIYDLE
ncbi:sodium-independent sulfate anion transporter-like isoform X3 [Diabrotica undecimpunctata]|uniref:sodium-independent sulfate anion transporter-like isoform X3 n=1 Tax=Diabrotica undecimpunctata TaxID=50387 RepID=UPI003B63990D